ncbi:MAG: hypothetical protein JW388_0743 [Nitrospira sp.]|nr:hypothetical protein [Nitrospira sp.]
MASALPRWCARCQAAHASTSACPAKAPRIELRDNATDRGYDSRWQKIRRIKRAQNPLCEHCFTRGVVRLAGLVDHIFPLACGGDHTLGNLQSLCVGCHAAKSADDRRRYPEAYDNRKHQRY